MSTQWNGIVAQKSEDREESMILAVRDEDEEQD